MTNSYVLVRHTGWSVSKNQQFKRGVEERGVSPKERKAIESASPTIKFYDDYYAASEAAYRANYSATAGLLPAVAGSFVKVKGFDEELYVDP